MQARNSFMLQTKNQKTNHKELQNSDWVGLHLNAIHTFKILVYNFLSTS